MLILYCSCLSVYSADCPADLTIISFPDLLRVFIHGFCIRLPTAPSPPTASHPTTTTHTFLFAFLLLSGDELVEIVNGLNTMTFDGVMALFNVWEKTSRAPFPLPEKLSKNYSWLNVTQRGQRGQLCLIYFLSLLPKICMENELFWLTLHKYKETRRSYSVTKENNPDWVGSWDIRQWNAKSLIYAHEITLKLRRLGIAYCLRLQHEPYMKVIYLLLKYWYSLLLVQCKYYSNPVNHACCNGLTSCVWDGWHFSEQYLTFFTSGYVFQILLNISYFHDNSVLNFTMRRTSGILRSAERLINMFSTISGRKDNKYKQVSYFRSQISNMIQNRD